MTIQKKLFDISKSLEEQMSFSEVWCFSFPYISHIKVKFRDIVSGKEGPKKQWYPHKNPVTQSFSEAPRILLMKKHNEKKSLKMSHLPHFEPGLHIKCNIKYNNKKIIKLFWGRGDLRICCLRRILSRPQCGLRPTLFGIYGGFMVLGVF